MVFRCMKSWYKKTSVVLHFENGKSLLAFLLITALPMVIYLRLLFTEIAMKK